MVAMGTVRYFFIVHQTMNASTASASAASARKIQ
jgi:hypothetical protein